MKNLIVFCMLLITLSVFSIPAAAGDIIGTVTSTAGDDITVTVKGSKMPEIGWSVDLFYVTSAGKELPVGTWKVQSIAGQTVTAVKVSGMGNANKKLKAVMYNRQKQQPVASQPTPKLQRAEPVNKLSLPATPAKFKPAPAKSSNSIQLLGQTAPAAVAPQKNNSLAGKPSNLSPRTQRTKKEPTAENKAAFSEYKKKLELINKQMTPLENLRQDTLAFWAPAKYLIKINVVDNDRLLGQAFGSVPTGARVVWIASHSPAKKALKVADIISEANGVTIQNAEHFKNIVKNTTEQKMKLKIQRNYEVIEKTINLKKK